MAFLLNMISPTCIYFSKQHNFILLCLNKFPVYTTHSTFDTYPGLPHNVGTPNNVSKAYLYLCHVDFELFEFIHRSGRVALCHRLVLRENTILSFMVDQFVFLPVPANSSLFSILSSISFVTVFSTTIWSRMTWKIYVVLIWIFLMPSNIDYFFLVGCSFVLHLLRNICSSDHLLTGMLDFSLL